MGKGEKNRGATMVEAAMIFPLMILLTVSILELGMAFKDFLTVSFTARDAARVGSLAGNDPEADCDIIQSVVAAFGPTDLAGVDILIFKANEATGNPVVGQVNTWTLRPSGDPTTCLPLDWSITENWPSTTRQVNVGPTTKLDILGVTIETTHQWITGLPPWRGTINVDRTALQRIEPEAFE
ncbi:MAG TPA: TadE family protein [Acidimicrobiia bacterium]|nr:TadE family protein [Acidimicrobiia bacterium]